MKAVVFGTGRIACGVLGEMVRDAGWDLVLVGRNADAVDDLRRHDGYRIRLVDGNSATERTIDGLTAVELGDRPTVLRHLADADVVLTAVGSGNLAGVAPVIAEALERRTAPVDVIACENHEVPGELLQRLVLSEAGDRTAVLRHGFAGGLVARAVAQRTGGSADGDRPYTFVGDPVRRLDVDAGALRNPPPPFEGLHAVHEFAAYVQRKLFVFSAGHATAAYLGHLKGYRYVHAAVRDPEIAGAVLNAMAEGQAGIAARYGAEFARFEGTPRRTASIGRHLTVVAPAHDASLHAILDRFANAALCDPVARVGRDPLRKLQRDDRLVGAARLAASAGVRPRHLVTAAAAALCFEGLDDPSAGILRDRVRTDGVSAALAGACGLHGSDGIADAVSAEWTRLTGGAHTSGNALLSIGHARWAWSA